MKKLSLVLLALFSMGAFAQTNVVTITNSADAKTLWQCIGVAGFNEQTYKGKNWHTIELVNLKCSLSSKKCIIGEYHWMGGMPGAYSNHELQDGAHESCIQDSLTVLKKYFNSNVISAKYIYLLNNATPSLGYGREYRAIFSSTELDLNRL